MFQGTEHINNTVEAVGTLSAWKSIGLIGMVTAMREKVEGVKTSGVITVTLVISLLGGTFGFGNIYFMAKETRKDTKEQVTRIEDAQKESKAEMNQLLATIMENANDSSALLAESFASQLELSHQLFNSELEKRDIKLNIAYESASQGPRHTVAMANDHEDMDNERYYEMREKQQQQEHNCVQTREHVSELQEMCKETRARVTEIEAKHTGFGFHSSGNGE